MGFKISWAARSNHISSLNNRRMNRSCPFPSKSQESWQESWEVTERERETYEDQIQPLQSGPEPKPRVTSRALTAWGSVFSGATLAPVSHTLIPGAATPAAPITPWLPRHTQVPHADFQKGDRKPFPIHLCIHPFPIISSLRKINSKKEDPVI